LKNKGGDDDSFSNFGLGVELTNQKLKPICSLKSEK
jgi:hypothetical protein